MSKDVLDPSLKYYIKAALGRKATDVVVLDVSQLTSFADVFIICTGKSNRQVSAIAEYIKTDLRKQGIAPISIEGMREGHWVLLDYGHILIHVFYESVREFYDLEGLWADAGQIPVADYVDSTEPEDKGGVDI
jgi:ribosome-associated protein